MENGGGAADDDDDDDIDLFGSDEDDEETARIKQERLDAYAAKKSKKPALIAKSSILLDVKPVCNHHVTVCCQYISDIKHMYKFCCKLMNPVLNCL